MPLLLRLARWQVIGFKKRHVHVSEAAGTVRLTVSRLHGGQGPCVLFFKTEDGTALAGYDYEPQSGQLHFLRGQKTKEIKVLVVDDDAVENDKSFSVVLSMPEGCTLHRKRKHIKVTIIDDDLDFFKAIKRSATYTAIEVFLIVYALFGNEIFMLTLINISQVRRRTSRTADAAALHARPSPSQPSLPPPGTTARPLERSPDMGARPCPPPIWVPDPALPTSQGRESTGLPPINPDLVDTVVGTATLVLFCFFFLDMCLQVPATRVHPCLPRASRRAAMHAPGSFPARGRSFASWAPPTSSGSRSASPSTSSPPSCCSPLPST